MPGTPPNTPNFAIPRYAASDLADFPTQVNAVSDQVDLAVQDALDDLGASLAAQVAAALAPWRTIAEAKSYYADSRLPSAGAAHTLGDDGIRPLPGAAGSPMPFVRLIPADYAVAGLDTELRVEGVTLNNDISSGVTWTFGLWAVSGTSGGLDALSVSLGAQVGGSSIALAPGTDIAHGASAAFAFPASGLYVLAVVANVAKAADSTGLLLARLQMRHVA